MLVVKNDFSPTSLEKFGKILFFILLLSLTLVLSSSIVSPLIFGVKINLIYVVFSFMVFALPLRFSIGIIILFSFFAELLSGSPPGFLVLLYMASFPIPVWFIKKNLYVVNTMIFFSFLVITGIIKVIIENFFRYISFGEFYYYLTKISIKEFIFNVVTAVSVFILLKFLRILFKYVSNIWTKAKEF